MKIIAPKMNADRIKKYLAEGKRFDGRKPEEFRDIKIETGVSKNAEGSSRVRMGDTEVICGVKLGIGTPYPDSPEKGNMMVTTELLPLSSPRFESGPPKFPAIELARVIDRGIREIGLIDVEKLCLEKGEKVWTVFIDIYPVNEGGNLLDAAGIAAVAALRTAKMLKYDKKEEKVLFGEWENKGLPLTKNIPFSMTIYKIGDNFVVDPTREEEDVATARITVGMSNGVISSMQKGLEESLTLKEMGEVLDLVEKVYKGTWPKIDKQVK